MAGVFWARTRLLDLAGREYQKRTSRHLVHVVELERRTRRIIWITGIEQLRPSRPGAGMRQLEIHLAFIAVHDDQDAVVFAIALDRGLAAAAVEDHADAHRPAIAPVGLFHLATGRIDPADVADVELRIVRAGEEAAAA